MPVAQLVSDRKALSPFVEAIVHSNNGPVAVPDNPRFATIETTVFDLHTDMPSNRV